MISKGQVRYLYGIITLVIIGLACFSYLNAKHSAETLVGASKEYFPLSSVSFGVPPMGEIEPVWIFYFAHPTIFDADFVIYVSVLGEVVLTNSLDLESTLRANEKLDVHPYSKEGVLNRFR